MYSKELFLKKCPNCGFEFKGLKGQIFCSNRRNSINPKRHVKFNCRDNFYFNMNNEEKLQFKKNKNYLNVFVYKSVL